MRQAKRWIVSAWLAAAPLTADDAVVEAILPPLLPWAGASRVLVAAADDPWITPAEAAGLERAFSCY